MEVKTNQLIGELKKWGANKVFIRMLLISLVAIFIVKWLAIDKTIKLYQEVSVLKAELNSVENLPERIVEKEKRLVVINSKIGGSEDYSNDLRQALLNCVDDFGCKLQIVDLKEVEQVERSGFEFQTVKLTLEGSYKQLLKFVHQLEKETSIGKIMSVDYHKEKLIREKKIELQLDIYFQGVKNLNNSLATKQ